MVTNKYYADKRNAKQFRAINISENKLFLEYFYIENSFQKIK